jgi:hypothetical protein
MGISIASTILPEKTDCRGFTGHFETTLEPYPYRIKVWLGTNRFKYIREFPDIYFFPFDYTAPFLNAQRILVSRKVLGYILPNVYVPNCHPQP